MKLTFIVLLALCLCLAGCSKKDSPQSDEPTEETNPLATPKAALTYQIGLLKAGDIEKLKACFTDRLKDSITAENMKDGQKEIAKYSFEDLYASESFKEYQGRKKCKIKMKNGRSLTTFVLTDGKWLADTIWYK